MQSSAYERAVRDVESWEIPQVAGVSPKQWLIGPVNKDACSCPECRGRSLGQIGYENFRDSLLGEGLTAWPDNNWGEPAGTPLLLWGDLSKEQRECWERHCAPDESEDTYEN